MSCRILLSLALPLLVPGFVPNGVAEPFSLGTRTVEIPEAGPATLTVLRTAKNELSFLPPTGWKAETDAAAGTITWTSPDYRSMIRLKVKDDAVEQTPKLQADALRQSVLQELPGASIKAELPCYTSGGSGLAFDCEPALAGESPAATRLAFVPIPGGMAQFNLTSPSDQFAKKQIDLSRFLNSFRVENPK